MWLHCRCNFHLWRILAIKTLGFLWFDCCGNLKLSMIWCNTQLQSVRASFYYWYRCINLSIFLFLVNCIHLHLYIHVHWYLISSISFIHLIWIITLCYAFAHICLFVCVCVCVCVTKRHPFTCRCMYLSYLSSRTESAIPHISIHMIVPWGLRGIFQNVTVKNFT